MKIPWPVKRSRGFTGEHVKPPTTSSRNAAPLTTHETEESTLIDVPPSPVARATHGFHPRAAGAHDGGSPTDDSPNQPDTKKCIQVGRDTYALTSQPGTSYAPHVYDSILVIDSGSPNDPHTDTPRKYKKPRSGSQTKRKPTEGPYKGRCVDKQLLNTVAPSKPCNRTGCEDESEHCAQPATLNRQCR